MTNSKLATHPESSMGVLDAIYNRRAVRDYLPQKIDKSIILSLLNAAVQAPTAMHEEPWSFAVIQNKSLLDRLSDDIKTLVRKETQGSCSNQTKHILDLVNQQNYHVFYNASTLIIIYCKFNGTFVMADCWLAAENLMLTAYAQGLGSCVIGFAVSALNTPAWKDELGVTSEMTAVAPIIIGIPAIETPSVPRKSPEVIVWK